MGRDHPEVDAAERHERERLGRQVEIRRDGGEDVARPRTRDGHADQRQPQHLEPDRAVIGQVVPEPARVMDLGRQRAEEVELVRLGGAPTVNSPTIRPASLSIAVKVIRPGAGMRWVSIEDSHASAPGPVTRYLA